MQLIKIDLSYLLSNYIQFIQLNFLYLLLCPISHITILYRLSRIYIDSRRYSFLLSFKWLEESLVSIKNFRFLVDLHTLGCFVTIFRKCLQVCDKNFVKSVTRKLIDRISWNFIFSCILIWIGIYQLLL